MSLMYESCHTPELAARLEMRQLLRKRKYRVAARRGKARDHVVKQRAAVDFRSCADSLMTHTVNRISNTRGNTAGNTSSNIRSKGSDFF